MSLRKTVFLDAAGVCLGFHRERGQPTMDLATFQAQHDAAAAERIENAPPEILHDKHLLGFHTKTSGDGTDLAHYTFTAYSRQHFLPNHREETLARRKVTQIEWWETDNGDGTFSDLARREVLTWQRARLLSKTITVYFKDGRVDTQTTETYTTGANGKRIVRKS